MTFAVSNEMSICNESIYANNSVLTQNETNYKHKKAFVLNKRDILLQQFTIK